MYAQLTILICHIYVDIVSQMCHEINERKYHFIRSSLYRCKRKIIATSNVNLTLTKPKVPLKIFRTAYI